MFNHQKSFFFFSAEFLNFFTDQTQGSLGLVGHDMSKQNQDQSQDPLEKSHHQEPAINFLGWNSHFVGTSTARDGLQVTKGNTTKFAEVRG